MLNNKIMEVVNGTMLGDGYINKSGALQVHHCAKQKDYVYFKYEFLKDLCPSAPRIEKRGDIRFYTSQKYFKELREVWYKDGRKVIPDSLKITPLILAIWFCDDGNFSPKTDRRRCNTLRICTQSYNYDEHKILQKKILSDLDIKVSIWNSGEYYMLSIPMSNNNGKKFIDTISPYVPDCMKYKLPTGKDLFDKRALCNNVYGRKNGKFESRVCVAYDDKKEEKDVGVTMESMNR